MSDSSAAPWCAPGYASSMFMGFGGLTQRGVCTLFLFEGGTLDTPVKFAFAWLGTVMLAVSVDAIAHVRHRRVIPALAASPVRRRIVDSMLFAAQITTAYFVMLVVMTYSGPLFAAAVFGLTIGHVVFADKPLHDATHCLPPEATPNNVSRV